MVVSSRLYGICEAFSIHIDFDETYSPGKAITLDECNIIILWKISIFSPSTKLVEPTYL